MKSKICITFLILTLLFGCKNNQSLNGNYSYCINKEYVEVYFKQDSMRVAADNEWVKLSKWRKIEIKNDTLYFETFGELTGDATAKIGYLGFNKIELLVLEFDDKVILEPINENLNIENTNEFWDKFYKRQDSRNCY